MLLLVHSVTDRQSPPNPHISNGQRHNHFYFHLAGDKWCPHWLRDVWVLLLHIFSPWIPAILSCQDFTPSRVNFHGSFLLRRSIWWMSVHVERTAVCSEPWRRKGSITVTHAGMYCPVGHTVVREEVLNRSLNQITDRNRPNSLLQTPERAPASRAEKTWSHNAGFKVRQSQDTRVKISWLK